MLGTDLFKDLSFVDGDAERRRPRVFIVVVVVLVAVVVVVVVVAVDRRPLRGKLVDVLNHDVNADTEKKIIR